MRVGQADPLSLAIERVTIDLDGDGRVAAQVAQRGGVLSPVAQAPDESARGEKLVDPGPWLGSPVL